MIVTVSLCIEFCSWEGDPRERRYAWCWHCCVFVYPSSWRQQTFPVLYYLQNTQKTFEMSSFKCTVYLCSCGMWNYHLMYFHSFIWVPHFQSINITSGPAHYTSLYISEKGEAHTFLNYQRNSIWVESLDMSSSFHCSCQIVFQHLHWVFKLEFFAEAVRFRRGIVSPYLQLSETALNYPLHLCNVFLLHRQEKLICTCVHLCGCVFPSMCVFMSPSRF